MTDKERLEDINNFSSLPLKKRISLTKESIKKELKANDYHMPKNININTQYLLEIIEQAERVEEIEKQRNERTQLLNAEVARNVRYKKVLEKIVNHAGTNKEIDYELWKMTKRALEE